MAEPSGQMPKVVGGGEATSSTGLVIPDGRMKLPFALECARQKVLICVAQGRSPVPGESGNPKGAGAWLGVSMGAVQMAMEGYLPNVKSTVCNPGSG